MFVWCLLRDRCDRCFRFLLGDENRDGLASFLDIAPFISLLSGVLVPRLEADTNLDGNVTLLARHSVAAFARKLTQVRFPLHPASFQLVIREDTASGGVSF